MSVTEPTPTRNLYQAIGGPEAIIFQIRAGAGGLLTAFTTAVKFIVTSKAGSTLMTLTNGSGITLSTSESVANGRATVQLSVAQSRLLSKGRMQRWELQDGSPEVIKALGWLTGEGGENPDA